MAADNQHTLLEIVINLIQNFFKTVKSIGHLASAETQLAKKTLLNIITLWVILRIFLLTTWLSFCGVIALYLTSLGYSLLFALSIICLLNFLVVLSIVLTILKIKTNLSFPATRRQIQLINTNIDPHKDFNNEQPSIENKTS